MPPFYNSKILDVHLVDQKVVSIDTAEELSRLFIGGVGLGVKILYDSVGEKVDPLASDNVIILATGPLSGTFAPSSGRTDAITKSPLTGIIGRGNFGGWWGPRLKRAGFEAVVIRGQAERPVYLWINDDHVELRGAEHLWGLDTWETTDSLRAVLGEDISVLSIGQAGENLVKFACPVADYAHAPGRSHVGCVMGAKRLKAIAVRGTKDVFIANPVEFEEAVMKAVDRITRYPERGAIMRVGTNYMVRDAAESGAIPARNFQNGCVAPDNDIWEVPEGIEKHLVLEKGSYCYHCPYAEYCGCDLTARIKEGPYAGLKLGGVGFTFPGFEWGAKCGIKRFPAIWRCRELCNRYGMDQTTSIPFALELFEKGIITEADTDGLVLKWGNELAIHQMIGKIAHREGIGDLLADGSEKAAQKIGRGAEKYSVTVKGMEVLSIDPRTRTWVEILGNLTSHRGGDDLDTTHAVYDERLLGWARRAGWSEETYLRWLVDWIDMPAELKGQIFGHPPRIEFLSRDSLKGKAALVKWQGDLTTLANALGLCIMPINYSRAMGPTHLAMLYSAYTGRELTPAEVLKTGERIFNLMKAYNLKHGVTRKDDAWPERFFKEPWPTGILKGSTASKKKINSILDEYYELRGWDKETGVPSRKKLVELGLDMIAEELSGLGWIDSKIQNR